MTEFAGLYDIRNAKVEDRNFVLATFLRGLYYGDSWFSMIPKGSFMNNYKKVAEALIASPNVIIKVACLREDPDVILGYSIMSANHTVLHFIFVKSMWRQKGIGRSLLPDRLFAVTHLTRLGKDLLPKLKDTVFDPFKT